MCKKNYMCTSDSSKQRVLSVLCKIFVSTFHKYFKVVYNDEVLLLQYDIKYLNTLNDEDTDVYYVTGNKDFSLFNSIIQLFKVHVLIEYRNYTILDNVPYDFVYKFKVQLYDARSETWSQDSDSSEPVDTKICEQTCRNQNIKPAQFL